VPHPLLYQVNTRVWLTGLGARLGRVATLDDVPESALADWAALGFDWIWFLGVWSTGPLSRAVSRSNPEWRREFERTLPDLRAEDIGGSCFAVAGYTVACELGGDAALGRLRERLARHGLRLMLDFVPNHVGLEHPWIDEHPEYFFSGTDVDVARRPTDFAWAGRSRRVVACGRDPYFPGWPDTAQLNYGEAGVRRAMSAELRRVAERCDGVRCDMAMLLLPEVFERTWGVASPPFWPDAIAAVRRERPDFRFLAEVYWDLEWTLQQQGFDYCYDKRLYDRLREGPARPVREHLRAGPEYQARLARFLENHDEPRAAEAFPPGRREAAAVLAYLVPGLRFFHQGQFEGRRARISPHLVRAPEEPTDPVCTAFYERLLGILRLPALRTGTWSLLGNAPAWEGNASGECLVAFAWEGNRAGRFLVTVNFAAHASQGYVRLPWGDLGGRVWRLSDQLGPAVYERAGHELGTLGLYLDVPAWQTHVFALEAVR
jgi:glycosidase